MDSFFRAGIAGDLGVEDDEALLELDHTAVDPFAVLLEQRATLRLRTGAALP
jgi:hypothetical protein